MSSMTRHTLQTRWFVNSNWQWYSYVTPALKFKTKKNSYFTQSFNWCWEKVTQYFEHTLPKLIFITHKLCVFNKVGSKPLYRIIKNYGPGFKTYCFYENRSMMMGFAATCSTHLCFHKNMCTHPFLHKLHTYIMLSVAVSTTTAIVSMMQASYSMKNSSWLVFKWWILSIPYCCMVMWYIMWWCFIFKLPSEQIKKKPSTEVGASLDGTYECNHITKMCSAKWIQLIIGSFVT